MVSDAVELVLGELHAAASEAERTKIARFYKGGDPETVIIGVRMKHTFEVARSHRGMSLPEVVELLHQPSYEARMVAVSVLDFKARDKRLSPGGLASLYETYLQHHDRIDNWDLVDRAAPHVVGRHLFHRSRAPLYDLAGSADPWRRRTAVTATLYFSRFGTAEDVDDVLGVARLLLDDEVELVAKSVGIALKYAADLDESAVAAFVENHAPRMSRVTLRFATERLPAGQKERVRSLGRRRG